MKNRHRFRQRLHRYAKMGALPAYLHPFVDETGDLRPVPWEILEKARETRSGRGYFCSDAAWFGLRPDGPPPEPPQEEYKAGVVETSELPCVSGPTDPPTSVLMRSEDWGCEPGKQVILEVTGYTGPDEEALRKAGVL